MSLMQKIKGWFSTSPEEQAEEAEEILRDPELGNSVEERRGGGGVMPGYTPGAVDREFEQD
jgi:hypothetical protein